MFIDARGVNDNITVSADLCIIGGGAAGIAIAREFIGKPVQVILLESGGITPDAATQSLYAGENIGLSCVGPEVSRSRFLGGSTNCWGGWCRPLDRIDFTKRPWMPNSGWPFGRDELQSYYEKSQALLQLGPYEYEPNYWSSELAGQNVSFFPIKGDRIVNVVDQFSPPARLGQLYRQQLEAAANVRVFLHANTTELETNTAASRVNRIRVATLDGVTFFIAPKTVVLCTGGIENARLLLNSNRTQATGLGNGHDLVGRYFMDHPALRTHRVRLTDQRQHRRLYDNSLVGTRRGLHLHDLRIAAHVAPSEQLQRQARLPNSRTFLYASYFDSTSATYIALKAIRQQMNDRKRFGVPLGRAAREIARNLPTILFRAPQAALALLDTWLDPKFIKRDFYLETVIEPIPNPDSRVTLSPVRDRLGMNQIRLDWRLTEQDKQNFILSQRLVREEMERQNLIVTCDPQDEPTNSWPEGIRGCWHHMGTTRMDPDPRKGVVDADCRVHGVSNLFIAGSSVFPTPGSDIPTMTIVALALRLCRKIEAALMPAQLTVGTSRSRQKESLRHGA